MLVNNSTPHRSRLRPMLGAAVTAAAATALMAFTPGTAAADAMPNVWVGSVRIYIPELIGPNLQPTGTGSLGSSSGSFSGSLGSLGSTSTGSAGSNYGSIVDSPSA